MTEQEIVQAIKDGRPYMVTVSSISPPTATVTDEVHRYTNMALAQLRGDVERATRERNLLYGVLHEAWEANKNDPDCVSAEICRKALDHAGFRREQNDG